MKKNILRRISAALLGLAVATAAFALPPYGIHQDFVDPSGEYFWGFYYVPPSPTNRYLLGYDGTVDIPSQNPLKMVAIGSGLSYDGTTLAATSAGTVTSVTCGTGLSGGTFTTTGTCSLPNSGCTTGTQEVTRFTNGNTGTLTIGLNITQIVSGHLGGVIPAGAYAQLVTENNTGTPTFTARPGQEVLL